MKTKSSVWVIMDYLTIHKIVDSPKEAYISAIELAIGNLTPVVSDDNALNNHLKNILNNCSSCLSDYVNALTRYNHEMIDGTNSSYTIQVIEDCAQVEVPCKCCTTKLNKGETPCWKCGTCNPTGV